MRFVVICKNAKVKQEVGNWYDEFMKIASKKFDYGMSIYYPSSKEVAFESVDDEVIWSFQDYLLDNLGMDFDFEDDFVFEESTKSTRKSLKESKIKNMDILELILEYYMPRYYSIRDLVERLIKYGSLHTDTNETVYLEDFDVDLKSDSLELDLEESINKIINDNLQLFHFIDEVVKYCDKKHIKYKIMLYNPNILDFTFDNFTYYEISELRDMIDNSYKILEDEYLAGDGRWIIVEL